MKVVFLGPPGAGKGTQAKQISHHFNLLAISTGDIFRSVSEAKDDLGIKVKTLMARGELIHDTLVVDLILSKLNASVLHQGFILDGFPRTVPQAQSLQFFLEEQSTALDAVINIKVDHSILFKRIETRVSQSNGKTRVDDTAEILKSRIDVYNNETQPLVSFYKDLGILHDIDGMKTIEDVTRDIVAVLSK